MDKMVDVVTFSRAITSASQNEVRAEIKAYLDDGYTLFSTHYAGIVSPELMMVFVLVKYVAADSGVTDEEPVPAFAMEAGEPAPQIVAKKRGRKPGKRLVEEA
jgi:hypothetical protein